jgi:hypothetical protein
VANGNGGDHRQAVSEHSSVMRDLPFDVALDSRSGIDETVRTTDSQLPPKIIVGTSQGSFAEKAAIAAVPDEGPLPKRKPATNNSTKLEEALHDAMVVCQHSDKKFLPIDALVRIITKEAIKEELESLDTSKLDDFSSEELDRYTSRIYDLIPFENETASGAPVKPSSRRLIFAILVMSGLQDTIFDFIRERFFDKNLPFCWSLEAAAKNTVPEGPNPPVFAKFMAGWKNSDRSAFDQFQWHMLAPNFDMTLGQMNHYPLLPCQPLPFLQSEDRQQVVQGGFSRVYKVEIHPAHHNYDGGDRPVSLQSVPIQELRLTRCSLA